MKRETGKTEGIPHRANFFFILCPSGRDRRYQSPASLAGSVAAKAPALLWRHSCQAVRLFIVTIIIIIYYNYYYIFTGVQGWSYLNIS
jgi:hypothetical protein